MNFTGRLTDQGAALLAKTVNGGILTITRVMAGAGITDVSASTLTEPQQEVTIASETAERNLATLVITLAASLAEHPYTLTELGVYAQDPDLGEILYQIYRLDQPLEISPDSRMVLRSYLRQAVSGNLQLELALPPSGLLVAEDLRGKADLVNGQVPYEQLPHTADVITRYVNAASGDDSNDGSQERPFRTIQAAVDSLPKLLTGGSVTISIAAGTYEEDIAITGFTGGNHFGTPFNVVGAGEKNTFIRGAFVAHGQIPVTLSNLSLSKGDCYGMIGFYYGTAVLQNVTIDAADTALGDELDSALFFLGGQAFLQSVTIKNAPNAAVQTSGSLFIYDLKGENNRVGVWVGLSPGLLGMVVTNKIPAGFAQTKFLKDYGNSMIFEGGTAV